MKLSSQRRIAAQLLKVGLNKVWFDKNRLDEIKEAITKADIRSLIKDLAIQARPKRGVSKYRLRKKLKQKRKGRRKGVGSREGKKTARLSRKKSWMLKIRAQRTFIKNLKEKKILTPNVYRSLYRRTKGGFFRSIRHIKLYIDENKLGIKK